MSPSCRLAAAGAGLSAVLVVGMAGAAIAFADPGRTRVTNLDRPPRVVDDEPAHGLAPSTTPGAMITQGRLVRLP